uniref:glycosyltransferase family 4 protein n=1 Tax=Algoriphagus sp. TaxID=1872435 RepID=UPI0040473C46
MKGTHVLLVGHSGDMYGASRSLLKLVRILNEQYTVYVLLPESGSLSAELTAILPADRILLNEDLYIFTRKSFKLTYLLSTLIRFINNLIFIRKIILKYGIDIIHTNSGVVPAPALAAKISGRKHIWHIREWFGDFKRFWPFYSAFITRFSDHVVCVSKTMGDQFHGHKKALPIYNGFEIPQINTEVSISEELQQSLNQAELVLGCTSRIRLIRKGQEYLIEAIGLLSQKTGKNIQAILIGDYVPGYEWQKETITSLIQKYQLEDRIHFLGHLTNPLPYYKLFDVFVLPSGEPEPFGGVIMEAMSLGLPVIGSNAGGTTEQIANGQNGYLFENKNPEDLANKIALLLNDPSSLTLFGDCSRKRIEKYFSLELHRKNILALYKGLGIAI